MSITIKQKSDTINSYYYYKSKGICTYCKTELAEEGKTKCLVCLMDERERAKTYKSSTESKYKRKIHDKRYKDLLVAFRVCRQCGKRDAKQGRQLCTHCLAKQRNYDKERKPRKTNDYGNGCVRCGDVRKDGFKLCERCYNLAITAAIKGRAKQNVKESVWQGYIYADVQRAKSKKEKNYDNYNS